MSAVKIQVFRARYELHESGFANVVKVDNKLAYTFDHSLQREITHLQRLIELLQLDNVEITEKARV